VKKIGYRYQRTIGRPTSITGFGLWTGAAVTLGFEPADPGTGIQFLRTDIPRADPIPARVEHVSGTNRRTVLGEPPNQVALVEHVLAALAGLRIDNCLVTINGSEPPGLDGSAARFVTELNNAGAVLQPARRSIWTVRGPLSLRDDGATLTFFPGTDQLKISYLLHYGDHSPIGWQVHTHVITPENLSNSLASCRTFLLEEEAADFRRQGWGIRTTPADLLVFGLDGPIQNRLRYADEPARHKILDLVGDLALFGHDLRGHVVAYRSGHPLNVRMARELRGRLKHSGPVVRQAA
jgi:UDP-3-O-acyl N-acetylglucosamine deacetylase